MPLSIGGWAPRNDNGEYLGQMPMRTALAKSVNSVAARLTLQVGPARVAQAAKRLGIRSPLAKDATHLARHLGGLAAGADRRL